MTCVGYDKHTLAGGWTLVDDGMQDVRKGY